MLLLLDEQTAPVEVREKVDRKLRVDHRASLVALDAVVVAALARDRVVEGVGVGAVEQLVALPQAVVVLAEGRRDVDDPGAVVGRHEVAGEDRELRLRRVVASKHGTAVEPPEEL